MGTLYIRSTTGADANSGSAWSSAKATFYGASQADNAGDTIYVSQAHSEVSADTTFFTWGGLTTLPVYLICASDAAEPPTSAATTASLNVSGSAVQIQCQGSVYAYGLKFRVDGHDTCGIYLHNTNNNSQLWENCTFDFNSITCNRFWLNATTGTSGDINFRNVTVNISGTSDFLLALQNDRLRWEGGAVTGTTPAAGIFDFSELHYTDALVTGVDFSGLGTSTYLMSNMGCGKLVLRNCKMPTNWNGGFYAGATSFTFRGELYNCQSGATPIRFRAQEHMGAITDETTIIRQNGADDGVNTYSLKLSANGNCNPAYARLRTPEVSLWNDITSATVTLAVDFLHDGATALTNREVALELQYFAQSNSPLSVIASSMPADPVVSASAIASSSSTWVTTGLAAPNKQRISLSFTPMQRGYFQARVVLMKSSYTIYADPRILVV